MASPALATAALSATLLTAYAAHAATPAAAAPAHLETCMACHGTNGRSSSAEIPHLAGQQAGYLAKQLQAFRSGERKNDMMQAVAAQLSPQEIQALAQYWSKLPADGGPHAAMTSASAPTASKVALVPSEMRFPADFPAGYTEYDRETDDKSRTVTVRYANRIALDAARNARALPSGAVVLSGEYAAVVAKDGKPELDTQGRWKLGALQGVAGMESRSGWGAQVPALLRNGDWHYGLWSPTGQTRLREMHAQCLACHQPRAAQNFVFTWDALRKPFAAPH